MSSDPSILSEIPVALCLGGLDPSGGAGLLRDVLTMASFGIQPMAIPVAETIQNGVGCSYIEAPGTSPLLRLESLGPHLKGNWGVKLGLCDLDIEPLRVLCGALTALAPSIRIWDPIQAPSCGVGLHENARLLRMAETILRPGGWIVSPNRLEAAVLAGIALESAATADPQRLAEPILAMGAEAVWLKGGHGEGDLVEDFWITRDRFLPLGAQPRLQGERRGTGCTLASAWLGYRLLGMDDVPAARAAGSWLREHWDSAFTPGGVGRPCFHPVKP